MGVPDKTPAGFRKRLGGIYPANDDFASRCGAIAIALPLGVGAAIYLVEYTREGRVTQLIRTGVDILNGTPSIVFGLFGFSLIVLYLNTGVSMLAGQVSLALMVLPTVIRTTEEALKVYRSRSAREALRSGQPNGRRSAGSYSRLRAGHCYPAILSIGRAAGSGTDHVYCGGLLVPFLARLRFRTGMALPNHLFILQRHAGRVRKQVRTALVLLMLVVGFYAVAIAVRTHFQKRMRG